MARSASSLPVIPAAAAAHHYRTLPEEVSVQRVYLGRETAADSVNVRALHRGRVVAACVSRTSYRVTKTLARVA